MRITLNRIKIKFEFYRPGEDVLHWQLELEMKRLIFNTSAFADRIWKKISMNLISQNHLNLTIFIDQSELKLLKWKIFFRKIRNFCPEFEVAIFEKFYREAGFILKIHKNEVFFG